MFAHKVTSLRMLYFFFFPYYEDRETSKKHHIILESRQLWREGAQMDCVPLEVPPTDGSMRCFRKNQQWVWSGVEPGVSVVSCSYSAQVKYFKAVISLTVLTASCFLVGISYFLDLQTSFSFGWKWTKISQGNGEKGEWEMKPYL